MGAECAGPSQLSSNYPAQVSGTHAVVQGTTSMPPLHTRKMCPYIVLNVLRGGSRRAMHVTDNRETVEA